MGAGKKQRRQIPMVTSPFFERAKPRFKLKHAPVRNAKHRREDNVGYQLQPWRAMPPKWSPDWKNYQTKQAEKEIRSEEGAIGMTEYLHLDRLQYHSKFLNSGRKIQAERPIGLLKWAVDDVIVREILDGDSVQENEFLILQEAAEDDGKKLQKESDGEVKQIESGDQQGSTMMAIQPSNRSDELLAPPEDDSLPVGIVQEGQYANLVPQALDQTCIPLLRVILFVNNIPQGEIHRFFQRRLWRITQRNVELAWVSPVMSQQCVYQASLLVHNVPQRVLPELLYRGYRVRMHAGAFTILGTQEVLPAESDDVEGENVEAENGHVQEEESLEKPRESVAPEGSSPPEPPQCRAVEYSLVIRGTEGCTVKAIVEGCEAVMKYGFINYSPDARDGHSVAAGFRIAKALLRASPVRGDDRSSLLTATSSTPAAVITASAVTVGAESNVVEVAPSLPDSTVDKKGVPSSSSLSPSLSAEATIVNTGGSLNNNHQGHHVIEGDVGHAEQQKAAVAALLTYFDQLAVLDDVKQVVDSLGVELSALYEQIEDFSHNFKELERNLSSAYAAAAQSVIAIAEGCMESQGAAVAQNFGGGEIGPLLSLKELHQCLTTMGQQFRLDAVAGAAELIPPRVIKGYMQCASDVHWNALASVRLRSYGTRICIGDIVCVDKNFLWDAGESCGSSDAPPYTKSIYEGAEPLQPACCLPEFLFGNIHTNAKDLPLSFPLAELNSESVQLLKIITNSAEAKQFSITDVVLPKLGMLHPLPFPEPLSQFPLFANNKSGQQTFENLQKTFNLTRLPEHPAAPLATYRRLTAKPLFAEATVWDDTHGIRLGTGSTVQSACFPTQFDSDAMRRNTSVEGCLSRVIASRAVLQPNFINDFSHFLIPTSSSGAAPTSTAPRCVTEEVKPARPSIRSFNVRKQLLSLAKAGGRGANGGSLVTGWRLTLPAGAALSSALREVFIEDEVTVNSLLRLHQGK